MVEVVKVVISHQLRESYHGITIEDIKKIFLDMFKQHQEAIKKKQEEMLRSHENSIMQLISGCTTLTNQRLDNLSKEIENLKESLELLKRRPKENLTNYMRQ